MKRGTQIRATSREYRSVCFVSPPSSMGSQKSGWMQLERQGASTIVHFRQLFREVLVNALCLDTEGKSRDRAPLSSREPRNGPSLLFPVSTPRYEDSYDYRESKTVHFCHLHPKMALIHSGVDYREVVPWGREAFAVSAFQKEFRSLMEGQLEGRGLETIPLNPPKREFGV